MSTLIHSRAPTEFVLGELFRRMRAAQEGTGPGFVVILGAGCSMQYGLPGFRDLLTYLAEDLGVVQPGQQPLSAQMRLSDLRTALDPIWRNAGDGERRTWLAPYLQQVSGEHCPSYRYLARLMKLGYVDAVVNMNFDLLFEEALQAEKLLDFVVSPSFQTSESETRNRIIKPNGSLKTNGGSPVLDLADSHLFADASEARSATDFLSCHHVLVLGYSGVDPKILEALRALPELPSGGSHHQEDYKLFVANVGGPDIHLPRIQTIRRSPDLSLSGASASFASIMEELHERLLASPEAPSPKTTQINKLTDYHPRAEHQALNACLRFALRLRSTINVADRGPFHLELHADKLYKRILELAQACRTPLTDPERFLARSATYLHDLGFYCASSLTTNETLSGLKLLSDHGLRTHDLLQHPLNDASTRDELTPATYREESRETVISLLLELCRCHSLRNISEAGNSKILHKDSYPRFNLQINGIKVPVRFDLLHAIFYAAEEIEGEHPQPFAGALSDEEKGVIQPIDDPITDLFLKGQSLTPFIEVSRHEVKLNRTTPLTAAEEWIQQRVSDALMHLSQVAQNHLGSEKTFFIFQPSHKEDGCTEKLIQDGLKENFLNTCQSIPPDSPGARAMRLDLLAIYTLPDLNSPSLRGASTLCVGSAHRMTPSG